MLDAVDPVFDAVAPVFEAVDPVFDAVEPVFDAVEPVVEPDGLVVEPVLDGLVAEAVEPVFEAVEPVCDAVDPVFDAVEPMLLPAPAAPPDMLALTSMKFEAAELAVPDVPVAPVVPVLDALAAAPEPDTRHPVTTTVWPCVRLPAVEPVCDEDPPADCAAAPTPSASAIIVPKTNCRFIRPSQYG